MGFICMRPSMCFHSTSIVLTALTLPPLCGVTNAGDVGDDKFLARAEHALRGGLRLVQLREKDWPAARRKWLSRV